MACSAASGQDSEKGRNGAVVAGDKSECLGILHDAIANGDAASRRSILCHGAFLGLLS
jgi:hypothetical protein